MRTVKKAEVMFLLLAALTGFSSILHSAHISHYGEYEQVVEYDIYCTFDGYKNNHHVNRNTPIEEYNEGCWQQPKPIVNNKPMYLTLTENLIVKDQPFVSFIINFIQQEEITYVQK